MLRVCPQGSNFGPLLWNIFQNDLVYNTDTRSIQMYADDRQMYVCGEAMEDVERTLTDEGRAISNWYRLNLLKCNPDRFHSFSLARGTKTK